MTRKAKTYLFVVGGAILLIIGVPIWFIYGPPRRLIVSKETTVLTEPLTADGQVDYREAYLQRQRDGVTPENNAAVPLAQATWQGVPYESPNKELTEYLFRELGIPEMKFDGMDVEFRTSRFRQLFLSWASDKWGVDLTDESIYDFDPGEYLEDVRYRPWRRADYPPLATWIDENEQRLHLLHDMEHRDKFYFPPPRFALPDRMLLGSTNDGRQQLDHAARALKMRAMMHIGEGNSRLAWRDLRLIYLMSRIHSKDSSVDDVSNAYAIERVAYDGMKYLLDSGNYDRPLLEEIARFLADLPPRLDVGAALDTVERWMILECGQNAQTMTDITIEGASDGYPELLNLPYDKNAMLRRINQRFDRWGTILKIDEPAKYAHDAYQQSDQDDQETIAWDGRGAIAAATISQSVRGVYAADVVCVLALYNIAWAKQDLFQATMEQQMLQVAIRLAIFHLEHGEYPETLSALADQPDTADLRDIYAPGDELHYERNDEGGYLLYSVFEDGVDDHGNVPLEESVEGDSRTIMGNFCGCIDPDYDRDLAIRFPIPAPTPLKKPLSKAEDLSDDPFFSNPFN
ncbi:hypothetical protein LOC68_16065 [Blastopirellula sp. JC732]|uniref:Uncharacterized protein n=1 Tax=Blastopirellula sediminis TaxID=2894196 RepID=A0A9X1SH99_9BACT|nr:hypothetical protein [Blastopirellula sediminis]MCC9606796.1 hypothetical protein [Blastopirellula sediminis]MCC9629907.1 hypothetical protein [Blastopirellula sediminis]